MLKYNNNLTLSKGGLDIGLKVGILAEIGYMLQECALPKDNPALCCEFCVSTAKCCQVQFVTINNRTQKK